MSQHCDGTVGMLSQHCDGTVGMCLSTVSVIWDCGHVVSACEFVGLWACCVSAL